MGKTTYTSTKEEFDTQIDIIKYIDSRFKQTDLGDFYKIKIIDLILSFYIEEYFKNKNNFPKI